MNMPNLTPPRDDIKYHLNMLIKALDNRSKNYCYDRVGVVEVVEANGDYGNILIEFIDGKGE
jgi:hypothetical protein